MIERYNMLELVEVLQRRQRGGRVGLWRCDCGRTKEIPFGRVRGGNAKSCGCLLFKHGKTGSPEYVAWNAMRSRCAATEGRDFYSYAGRGIGICERWDDFANFLSDMGPKPSPAHSLGRIDNDVGYELANCRWETAIEQQRNTRRSMQWTVKGLTFSSCREAGAHFGVDQSTIRYWVRTIKENCHAEHRY
jgi:hypothetical protein